MIEIIPAATSFPLFFLIINALSFACLMLLHVKMPKPIGFFELN